MRKLIAALLAFGAAAGAVPSIVACTSSSSSSGGFGGTISGSAGSTGSSGPRPPSGGPSNRPDCQSQPNTGDSCTTGVCEYGGAADPGCNTIATCISGSWAVQQPTYCPSTCPLKFDERAPGATCSDPDLCTYLEATCGCAGAIVPPSSNVDSGADDSGDGSAPDPDAGTNADAGTPLIGQWQCVRPGDGCPARRPLPGAACNKAMLCDYGTCLFGLPLTLECAGVGAEWRAVAGPECP